MRSIGMDVHRDFCEIAIAEGGSVRAAGRILSTPAALELFARSLAASDEVAIEVVLSCEKGCERHHIVSRLVVLQRQLGVCPIFCVRSW